MVLRLTVILTTHSDKSGRDTGEGEPRPARAVWRGGDRGEGGEEAGRSGEPRRDGAGGEEGCQRCEMGANAKLTGNSPRCIASSPSVYLLHSLTHHAISDVRPCIHTHRRGCGTGGQCQSRKAVLSFTSGNGTTGNFPQV